jgi:polysaccharide biosynthesis/export protein
LPDTLMSLSTRFHPILMSLLLLPALSGCRTAMRGPYVEASRLPVESEVEQLRIQVGDALSVRVWNNEPLSVEARVRSDGKFTVPLVGEIDVVGQTPEAIARRVETSLSEAQLVLNPRVTVMLDESVAVSVLGKVVRAGSYSLVAARGVADALAAAGGLSEFARPDHIYVLRRLPTPQRIRFRFHDLFNQADASSRFRLRSGDVLLVD